VTKTLNLPLNSRFQLRDYWCVEADNQFISNART